MKLFVFDKFSKHFQYFSSVLNLALLGVKGLRFISNFPTITLVTYFCLSRQTRWLLYFNCVLFVWFPRNRKRGKAKLCAVATWEANCNKSEIADGIYNKVIGEFNPFCSNEKDPWASEPDLCAYNDPKPTPKPTDKKVVRKNGAGIRHGVAPVSLNLLLCMAAILYLDNLIIWLIICYYNINSL